MNSCSESLNMLYRRAKVVCLSVGFTILASQVILESVFSVSRGLDHQSETSTTEKFQFLRPSQQIEFLSTTSNTLESTNNISQVSNITTAFSSTLQAINAKKQKPESDADESGEDIINKSNTTSAVPADNSCIRPRQILWEYDNYTASNITNDPKPNKRLLIGLYSGFGVYSQLLTKTAHVNRVYARHWGHDVALVQGAALRIPELDGDCEPPPHRATYNKIPLLQYALQQKEEYDQLLILDTDALVYDMDFDVTTLLPEGYMLAAHKVKLKDGVHTWNVNAGVTLWDLHHPRVDSLAATWESRSTYGMQHDYHVSNDQFHLHDALQEPEFEGEVLALKEAFSYGHGTVVKHFIRKPQHKVWGESAILDNREDRIDMAIEEICSKDAELCRGVDKRIYEE